MISKYPLLINAHDSRKSPYRSYTPLLELIHLWLKDDSHQKFSDDNIRFLLEKGADVNAMDKLKYRTPLTHTCDYSPEPGALPIATLLIQHGANVNALQNGTYPPLHMAVLYSPCNTDMVELLLNSCADKTYTDSNRQTVADIAREHRWDHVATFIENFQPVQPVGSSIKKAK